METYLLDIPYSIEETYSKDKIIPNFMCIHLNNPLNESFKYIHGVINKLDYFQICGIYKSINKSTILNKYEIHFSFIITNEYYLERIRKNCIIIPKLTIEETTNTILHLNILDIPTSRKMKIEKIRNNIKTISI
jgi:hypothetical protein